MLIEKTFDAGDVTLHYVEGPAAGLPLILLHGANSRWQSSLPVLPMLSFRYHIHALDMRGFGRSGRTPGAYRNGDFAGDIGRFLRERIGKPTAILGHSLGAGVAAQVAAEMPDLTLALILNEPANYVLSPKSWRMPEEPPIILSLRRLRDLLVTYPSKEELLVAERKRLPGMNAAELRAKVISISQMDPDVLTHIVEGKTEEQFHADELLPKIACPVLLLQGNPALGAVVNDQQVERSRTLLADCTHIYFPEAGHSPQITHPLEFSQSVMNFLESL